MRLVEIKDNLPPNVVKSFMAVADMQRGAPEHAMLRVQRTMGGGVLSVVVEHVGDLTHRSVLLLRHVGAIVEHLLAIVVFGSTVQAHIVKYGLAGKLGQWFQGWGLLHNLD